MAWNNHGNVVVTGDSRGVMQVRLCVLARLEEPVQALHALSNPLSNPYLTPHQVRL